MLVVYQTITERLAWQPDACNLLALSPTVTLLMFTVKTAC